MVSLRFVNMPSSHTADRGGWWTPALSRIYLRSRAFGVARRRSASVVPISSVARRSRQCVPHMTGDCPRLAQPRSVYMAAQGIDGTGTATHHVVSFPISFHAPSFRRLQILLAPTEVIARVPRLGGLKAKNLIATVVSASSSR